MKGSDNSGSTNLSHKTQNTPHSRSPQAARKRTRTWRAVVVMEIARGRHRNGRQSRSNPPVSPPQQQRKWWVNLKMEFGGEPRQPPALPPPRVGYSSSSGSVGGMPAEERVYERGQQRHVPVRESRASTKANVTNHSRIRESVLLTRPICTLRSFNKLTAKS